MRSARVRSDCRCRRTRASRPSTRATSPRSWLRSPHRLIGEPTVGTPAAAGAGRPLLGMVTSGHSRSPARRGTAAPRSRPSPRPPSAALSASTRCPTRPPPPSSSRAAASIRRRPGCSSTYSRCSGGPRGARAGRRAQTSSRARAGTPRACTASSRRTRRRFGRHDSSKNPYMYKDDPTSHS